VSDVSQAAEPHPSTVAAQLLRDAAGELQRAAGHSLVAAGHIEMRAAPRMGAHAWAARGHIVTALEHLDRAAQLHATMSSLPEDSVGGEN
jgi:hypothetical protein